MFNKGEGKMKTRHITLDMILASTHLTRSRAETNETYLQRVTHLHLQGQRLKKLEKLEMCTNLKVSHVNTVTYHFLCFFLIVIVCFVSIGFISVRQSNRSHRKPFICCNFAIFIFTKQ